MTEIEEPEVSQILGLGKTPTQWVEVMMGMGIDVSERTLRERANATGAFYRLGRTMLITPAQIDAIFEWSVQLMVSPPSNVWNFPIT